MPPLTQEQYTQLKTMPIFSRIQQEDLRSMLACIGGYTRQFGKGAPLSLSAEPAPSVGVVLSGSVQMVKEDVWGSQSILAVSHPGELFGESFVCSGSAQLSVSFYASEDTQVLYLPFHRVMHSCSHACQFHHQLIENMMTMVAVKNIKLMDKLEITSKKTLRERVLTYLSAEAQKSGSKYITLAMNRNELADYLCADRSALSRELSNMKKEGLLDYDRNTFTLLS